MSDATYHASLADIEVQQALNGLRGKPDQDDVEHAVKALKRATQHLADVQDTVEPAQPPIRYAVRVPTKAGVVFPARVYYLDARGRLSLAKWEAEAHGSPAGAHDAAVAAHIDRVAYDVIEVPRRTRNATTTP